MKNQEMASEEGGSSSGGSAGSAGGGSSPHPQMPYHPAYRPQIPATPMMPPAGGGGVAGVNGGLPGSGMPHALPMPVRITHHIKVNIYMSICYLLYCRMNE